MSLLSLVLRRISAVTEGFLFALLTAILAGVTGLSLISVAGNESPNTVQGVLIVRHGDDFSHGRTVSHSYALRSGDVETQLKFAGAVPADSLSGRAFRLTGTREGGQFLVAANGMQQISSASTSAPVAIGARRVAVVLLNFSNDPSEPYTPAFAGGVAFNDALSVAAYYAEGSWNQVTLSGDVFGWYTIPDTNANCAYGTWSRDADAAATSAGVDLAAYDNVVYAFPATSCGWAGMAAMPGRDSWLNGPGAMNLRVMAHELGHNFGTHHASSLSCTVSGVRVPLAALPADCSAAEYGDPFSVMGMSGQNEHSNFSRRNFGWLADANTLTATASGDYTLHPIGVPDSEGIQLLRVARSPGAYLTLEFRQPSGLFDDFSATAAIVNGIGIRVTPDETSRLQSQLVDATPETTSFLDSALLAGQTLTDPLSGISITTMSVASSGAVVRLSFTSEPVATQPPPATPAPAPTPTPTPTATPTPPPTASPTPGATPSRTPTPTSNADAEAPTAPSGVVATVGKGKKVTISWAASTDNVGVSGYRIFRNGALIATVSGTTLTDSVGRIRQLAYVVVAFDAAGNTSPPSSAVSVTL